MIDKFIKRNSPVRTKVEIKRKVIKAETKRERIKRFNTNGKDLRNFIKILLKSSFNIKNNTIIDKDNVDVICNNKQDLDKIIINNITYYQATGNILYRLKT